MTLPPVPSVACEYKVRRLDISRSASRASALNRRPRNSIVSPAVASKPEQQPHVTTSSGHTAVRLRSANIVFPETWFTGTNRTSWRTATVLSHQESQPPYKLYPYNKASRQAFTKIQPRSLLKNLAVMTTVVLNDRTVKTVSLLPESARPCYEGTIVDVAIQRSDRTFCDQLTLPDVILLGKNLPSIAQTFESPFAKPSR